MIPTCLQFNPSTDRKGDKSTVDLNESNCQNLKLQNHFIYTSKYLVQSRLQTDFHKPFLDENDGCFIPRNFLYLQKVNLFEGENLSWNIPTQYNMFVHLKNMCSVLMATICSVLPGPMDVLVNKTDMIPAYGIQANQNALPFQKDTFRQYLPLFLKSSFRPLLPPRHLKLINHTIIFLLLKYV